MPIFCIYLLKLSCSLVVVWLFYRLVLRNLTFYGCNRWYLLGYSLLAFLIPMVDVGPVLNGDRPDGLMVLQFIPTISSYTPAPAKAQVNRVPGWSAWTLVLVVLLLGMLLLLVRVAVRWLALQQLRRSATLVRDGKWKIYQVDETITPFSFGKAIFINRGLHSEKEWEEIILHEYEHVRGWHTVDIVIAEWLTILNWYNPAAWLIRHSIRQNLEFIADRRVLAGGFDKKGYQYHLLRVIGEPRYRLANNFNFSSLKKRIIMMNKLRSARVHLVKFLFILPLLAVLLAAFRGQYHSFWVSDGSPVYVNTAGIVLGLPGEAPLVGVKVRERRTGLETTTDSRGYYKLKIPVTRDSLTVYLELSREGYLDNQNVFHLNFRNGSTGAISICAMTSKTQDFHGSFIGIPIFHGPTPVDPSYADAVLGLKESLLRNGDARRLMNIYTAHPEVALFYTVTGMHRELVVHTDGSVERFGYPGGPTIIEMGKKYGGLPSWLTGGDTGPGSGYLAYWASVSAAAGKAFHTTNPTARAIIFPGDSRVIAVDGSGKARFYDMNNDAPEERPAFEKEYGKLPDCVPNRAIYHTEPLHRQSDTIPSPGRDTPHDAVRRGTQGRDTVRVVGKDSLSGIKDDYSEKGPERRHIFDRTPLYVIDGVLMDTFHLQRLNPGDIQSIEVLGDSSAVTRYGPKGRNGAILITLRSPHPLKP